MADTYYSIFSSGKSGEDLANKLDSDLQYNDLNLAIMGDSISVIASPEQWIDTMLDRLSFASVNRLAKSGATISHTTSTIYDTTITGGAISDNNVIWNQFNILKEGIADESMVVPDVVYIFAGTNDLFRTVGAASTEFASGVTILDKTPGEIINICKGVRFVVENILSEWPNCQVILATPIQRGRADSDLIFNIAQAIEDCGKFLSTSVIRSDKESGIYGFNEIDQDIFLSDDLHPNEAGAIKIGKLFTNKLRSMILR